MGLSVKQQTRRGGQTSTYNMKYHETDLYGAILQELSHKRACAVIADLGYEVPTGKGKHNDRSLAVLARLKAMTATERDSWVAQEAEKRRSKNWLTMTDAEKIADAKHRQDQWDKQWAAMTPKEQENYMASAQRISQEIDFQESHYHHSTHTV